MIEGKYIIVGRPCSAGGHALLRCTQHLEALSRNDLAFGSVIDEEEDDPELSWKAKCEADVFVSCGCPRPNIFTLVEDWAQRGRKWVWDVDDDPLNISPFNDAYRVYGLRDISLEEVQLDPLNGRRWLWKDGVEGFNLGENIERHESFVKLLREHVAAITTTTPYLASKLEKIAPDVPIWIRPNFLDFETIWTRRNKPSEDGKIRILYQGGSSHYADLASVLPTLRAICDQYPQVVFVFAGDTKAHAEKLIPSERIEFFEWTADYASFALRSASLSADIAIAPLSGDKFHAEFNRCKSSLKWLDAAALGVPSVCQWGTPYQEVINFGQCKDDDLNGLLAHDHEDWFVCLSALIENPNMREVVGRNALKEAMTKWNVDNYAQMYLDQYRSILDGDPRNDHPERLAGASR